MKKPKVHETTLEDMPDEFHDEAKDTIELTEKITDVLRQYNVSVVVSALMSSLVQALCVTRDSKAEALAHAENIAAFMKVAIEQADKDGICSWNSTLQ